MAYDVTEERLKVKGSEQITRDLKVNRDAFINGKAETGSIDDKGDLKVAGEILAGDDVTISGDLYVNGTEYINDSETAQTTDNYLVLRHNQTTPLGTDEYSGVAVHNYNSGKTATITTDKDGTWRVADNTETDTDYTNISYYNGTYYTGLTRTAATVISGMKTAFDEDELDESVYYNTSYYHFDGSNWFPVSLVDNKLTLGSAVTDSTTITALNALTKEDLVYFRTLTITVINPVENQPVLTRAESSDLTGGQALTWDATNQKAVGKTIDTTVTANSSNLITSGAVNTAISNAVDALDVSSVGGDGKYISAISETNGKISATSTTMDTSPTASSTKAVTSGGVKTAIDNEATARNTAITNAINALDVASAGGDGKYISAISETDGKISATATTMDTAPTASSTKAVTSGGVKTAINTAETNAKNLANATGTLAIANGGTGATTAANARTCLGLGSVSTINTNASTSQYLRGDGTWATPPSSTGTVTVSNKAAANADTPIALCTGTTSVGRSTGSSLNFNTCTGVLSADRFSGRSCGIVELDTNRSMNANWGIFNVWNYKGDNRSWLVSQNKNCLTSTQTVAVDYATSAASATSATSATSAACATCAACGMCGSTYKAFGTNAFNSTAFTTCTGTVTVANVSANASYPIALCTGTTAIGSSTGCALTFNPGNGALSVNRICLNRGSYIGAPEVLCICTRTCSMDSVGSLTLNGAGVCGGEVTIRGTGTKCGRVYICANGVNTAEAIININETNVFCIDSSGRLHLKSGKTICYDL